MHMIIVVSMSSVARPVGGWGRYKLVSELRETSCSDVARPVGGWGCYIMHISILLRTFHIFIIMSYKILPFNINKKT
jgi:hypothetical protein